MALQGITHTGTTERSRLLPYLPIDINNTLPGSRAMLKFNLMDSIAEGNFPHSHQVGHFLQAPVVRSGGRGGETEKPQSGKSAGMIGIILGNTGFSTTLMGLAAGGMR